MDHRKIIDQLTHLETERKEAMKGLRVREPEDEEIAGLKFGKGQKALDKTTGKEVEIIAGRRTHFTLSGPGGGGSEGLPGQGQGRETPGKSGG